MPAERLRPAPLATTGIGSLPHTQLELAIQAAFQVDVPYAPQLPRQNPAEFMIPQALEGLPGLEVDAEGTATVDLARWRRDAEAFSDQIDAAIDDRDSTRLEPTAGAWRAWKPFLWEVEHRKLALAKAQLAGPATVRWVVKLTDGQTLDEVPDLDLQCHRLVVARLLAMARVIRRTGAEPLLFLDEPGLYALDRSEPRHLLMLQELRLVVMALQKEGALVGLHCCGDTDWGAVLGLGLDYVSMDVRLSLAHVLERKQELQAFVADGGSLALGVVPTNVDSEYATGEIVASVPTKTEERFLGRALLTPACGLAMRTVPEAEKVFGDLRAVQRKLKERL